MSSIDSWISLCDSVTATPDPAHRAALVDALVDLGLSDAHRTALSDAVPGSGPLAQVLQRLTADAPPAPVIHYAAAPAWSDSALESALAAARAMGAGEIVGRPDLAALPPDEAAALVSSLLSAGDHDSLDWVLPSTTPHRFPVAEMLRHASGLPNGHRTRASLVTAVAAAPEVLLLRGVTDALADEAVDDEELAVVLAEVARARSDLARSGPYRWWLQPQQEAWGEGRPDGVVPETATPAASEASGAEPRTESGAVPRAVRAEPGPVWRSGEEDTRTAFPRLDVDTKTARADVVVVDTPFERDRGAAAAQGQGAGGRRAEPIRRRRDGRARHHAALRPGLDRGRRQPARQPHGERRDAVPVRAPHLHGALRREPRQPAPAGAPDPAGRPGGRGRLAHHHGGRRRAARGRRTGDRHPRRRPARPRPAGGEDAPDLVVSVCRGDVGSTTWIWAAFAADPDDRGPRPAQHHHAGGRRRRRSRPRPAGRSRSPPTRPRTSSTLPDAPGGSAGRSRRASRTPSAP